MTSGQHAVSEDGDVVGGGEESGVSGHSAHEAGVLVVNLSLDDAMAECLVVDSGRNLLAPIGGRGGKSGGHFQGGKNLFLAEGVLTLVRGAAQGVTREDEGEVGR